MHELAITESLVDCVAEHVGDARVLRVVVAVGELSGVAPEAMRGCFALCAEGTALEGAVLEIVGVDAVERCCSCGGERSARVPLGPCACGHPQLEMIRGRELFIREVEVI